MTATLYEEYKNPGRSKESTYLREQFKKVDDHRRRMLLTYPSEMAKEELVDVFVQRLDENWDGYGAEPLNIGAFTEATRFIDFLPDNYQMPEASPEPSGSIGLEWYYDELNIISIGFHGNGRASYAAIINGLPRDGDFYLNGGLPKSILGLFDEMTEFSS